MPYKYEALYVNMRLKANTTDNFQTPSILNNNSTFHLWTSYNYRSLFLNNLSLSSSSTAEVFDSLPRMRILGLTDLSRYM